MYTDILNKRVTDCIQSGNLLCGEQNGFRKYRYRSCLDHLYGLHTAVHNRMLQKKPTFACFVDVKKASDRVNRTCLWYKLQLMGLKGKMYLAIKALYDDVKCKVRVNNYYTDTFPVSCGVRQGCNYYTATFPVSCG